MVVVATLVLSVGLLFPSGNVPSPNGEQRNYMLVFEMTDYNSELKDALNTFFKDVFKIGDQLIVVTPARLMGFSPKKLALPKRELAKQILAALKKDIAIAASKYRDILREMQQIAQGLSGAGVQPGGNSLESYLQLRKNQIALKSNQQAKMLKYAKIFRTVRGNNNILMFLQQEFRPIPDRDTMNSLLGAGGPVASKAREAFHGESVKVNFNLDEIKAQFRYASVRFHFLYLKSKKNRSRRGLQYVDALGDIYSDFSKLAKATHGVKATSAKPGKFIKDIKRAVVVGKVETEVVDQKMEK